MSVDSVGISRCFVEPVGAWARLVDVFLVDVAVLVSTVLKIGCDFVK